MPRETKQDLLDRIEDLKKQNERLIQDKHDYFIRMQNAELEAERLKKQLEDLKAATTAPVHKMPVIEQPQNPRRGRPAKVSDEDRQKVIALHAAGGSIRTISKETGLSVGTVHGILHSV